MVCTSVQGSLPLQQVHVWMAAAGGVLCCHVGAAWGEGGREGKRYCVAGNSRCREHSGVLAGNCRNLPTLPCCCCRTLAGYAQVIHAFIFYAAWGSLVLMYWEVSSRGPRRGQQAPEEKCYAASVGCSLAATPTAELSTSVLPVCLLLPMLHPPTPCTALPVTPLPLDLRHPHQGQLWCPAAARLQVTAATAAGAGLPGD